MSVTRNDFQNELHTSAEKQYDLIVVGGGFAGVSAALSAARNGLSVLLIDRAGSLGGAAVNNLVLPFMPYFTVTEDNERIDLCRGIFAEILASLKEKEPRTTDFFFAEEDLKLILDRKLILAGVDLLLHSYLYDILRDGDRILGVKVANKSGRQTYRARFYIDATGDADLAYLADCPTRLGREPDHLCQPMTLCFRMANVDMPAYEQERESIQRMYKEWQGAGKLRNPREDILIFKPSTVDGVLHFNTTRVIKHDPTSAVDLTHAEIEAREQVHELVDMLTQNFDAFRHSSLIMTAPAIGVRESRMIVGEYVLTGEDLKACTKYEDAIAAGNYEVDIHNPEGSGTSHYFFPRGAYYTIPYRALVPMGVDNLLVAGRCISSDHEAQASYRIMPICAAIGEAAGVAASVAVRDGAKNRDVSFKTVQSILRAQGAFVG